MKEHIYTIPVMDGFHEGGECPFCNMYHKLNSDAVDYMLGPSYMEEDIRLETDKQGFCGYHYKQLYSSQNRLGLALMLHTHLQRVSKDMAKYSSGIAFREKVSIFSKATEPISKQVTTRIDNVVDSCYICNRVDEFFAHYIETFFHLWKQNNDLKKIVEQSNGFCMKHFSMLLRAAELKLKQSELKSFYNVVMPIQQDNLNRLIDEVDWFIQKFDYRFQDEPWKNSQDSVPRSIQKVSSVKEIDKQ